MEDVKKDKKWLTCQISPDDFLALEQHCQKTGKTKTDVIRDFIQNIDLYTNIKQTMQKKVLEQLVMDNEPK